MRIIDVTISYAINSELEQCIYYLCVYYMLFYRVSEPIGTTTQFTKRTGRLKMPFFKLFNDENIVNIQNNIFNVKNFKEKAVLNALCVL